MGECYWCRNPDCSPWGDCRIPEFSDLELEMLQKGEAICNENFN